MSIVWLIFNREFKKMPELPEVETTLRGISPLLISKKVLGGRIHEHRLRYEVRKDLIETLAGQTLLKTDRRGKYLILTFTNGSLIIHLGMSGSLRILAAEQPRRKHDHVEIIFENLSLRYHDPRRFGSLVWTAKHPFEHKLLRHLGLEPLGSDFNGDYMYSNTKKIRTPIKNTLMNNRIVVGVGNIYANEALFLAGIHPKRLTNRISLKRYRILATKIKIILSEAIEQGGTTLRDFYNNDGRPGYFKSRLRIYGRRGASCDVCKKPVRTTIIGQRTTYYCNSCQS